MIAEPLEKGLAEDIEAGNVSLNMEKSKVYQFFQVPALLLDTLIV